MKRLRVILVTLFSATALTTACTKKDKSQAESVVDVSPKKSKKKGKKARAAERIEDEIWEDGVGGTWFYFDRQFSWKEAQTKCAILARKTGRRWRLPSPDELQESRRLGISSSKNPIFGYHYLGPTWTQNWETSFDTRVAVYVDMNSAKELRTDMGKKFTTLCVRSDSLTAGDAWTDQEGKVVWRYVEAKADWKRAGAICEQLAEADKLPWRLSSREELTEAVEHGIQSPANKAFGREYLTQTWSKEMDAKFPTEAYAVDLRNKHQFLFRKDQKLSVVCVRPLAH